MIVICITDKEIYNKSQILNFIITAYYNFHKLLIDCRENVVDCRENAEEKYFEKTL